MEWTPEEKELFQELREMPKVQLSNNAREKMNELMKRQAAVDRKRKMMKLAAGGMAGVAAAIGLTIGIMNFDQIKSKLESQIAGTNENPTATTQISNTAPKTFEYNGRNIDMEKVVAELGDRKTEVSRILGEMRDLIDNGNAGTLNMMSKIEKLIQLVPEANSENQRILSQGAIIEKGFPDPMPAFPFNEERKKKYQEIKELDVIRFVGYIQELAANAGMYASDLSTEQRQANMKKVRDIFDEYSRFFSEK